MKIIGLVGGTGWISTLEYYRIINEEVNKRLGGLEFAKCILYSLNYGEVHHFNQTNNNEGVYLLALDASLKIINAGADCIVLCANTFHQYAEKLKTKIGVPIIHVAEATAKEIKKKDFNKIGLLGTRQTMEMDFYKAKLNDAGIEVFTPGEQDRIFIQDSISNELLKGIILEESRNRFNDICEQLIKKGTQGIILGCTEIPLIMKQEEVSVPLFNTLEIHAKAAVDFALN